METWTKTCGLPLLFNFEPRPLGPGIPDKRSQDTLIILIGTGETLFSVVLAMMSQAENQGLGG